MHKALIKKIAITGLSGVIGQVLSKRLSPQARIIDLYHTQKYSGKVKIYKHVKLDLLNLKKISSTLKLLKPDVIVHMAAITHIDTCEKDKKFGQEGRVWKTNVDATYEIAKFCARNNTHMIFLSTECVFDGKEKIFYENSKKNPINWYGKTKNQAEDLLIKSHASSTILRSVVAYHQHDSGKTIYGKILKELKSKKKIKAVGDQFFTPTHTEDIAQAIIRIIDKQQKGIYHVAPNKNLTPYDFAVMIAKKNNFSPSSVEKKTLRSFYDPYRAQLRLRYACLSSEISNKILKFTPSTPEEVLFPSTEKKPLVSIVIPTYNRREVLLRLLKSLLISTYKNIEIIVVDDASNDGTFEALQTKFKGNKIIKLIRNKRNLFAAGSRNEGIKYTKGKYIFFIDDDNVVDRNTISELIKVFQEDSLIGEAGPVNYSYLHKKKIVWAKTRRNMFTSKTNQSRNLKQFGNLPYWDSDDIPNAYMVRSDIIKNDKIYFKNHYGIMYEESDLAYRIKELGYSIKVVRKAKIYHDIEQKTDDGKTKDYMFHFMNDRRRLYIFARNRILFHKLFSTHLQFALIICIWIWVFTIYYGYKILFYSGAGSFSLNKRLKLVLSYILGNMNGLYMTLFTKTYKNV